MGIELLGFMVYGFTGLGFRATILNCPSRTYGLPSIKRPIKRGGGSNQDGS